MNLYTFLGGQWTPTLIRFRYKISRVEDVVLFAHRGNSRDCFNSYYLYF